MAADTDFNDNDDANDRQTSFDIDRIVLTLLVVSIKWQLKNGAILAKRLDLPGS